MIIIYGMSRQVPNLSLMDSTRQSFIDQGPGMINHSPKLEELIDNEVQEMIQTCYQEARQVLSSHHDKLEEMARQLLKREKIDENDIIAILGPRPQQEVASASEKKEEENTSVSENQAQISSQSAVNSG
jgi:cell division protease FtsH